MSVTSLAEKRNHTYTVLVTGSRDWAERQMIFNLLDGLLVVHKHLVLIHGACPTGADAIADRWGRRHENVLLDRHPAKWGEHGKAAGPLRNIEMVQTGPDVCLAFILNDSKGATHCARAAQRAGIQTEIFQQWTEAPVG